MFTLFSIPKAFKGHESVIQENAIQSWIRLHPDVEVILCADDPGTEEVARKFNVKYIPDVDRNEYGTPLLNSAFEKVCNVARHRLLYYVNADIILMGDFVKAAELIKFPEFLVVGQRWDLDVGGPLDFEGGGWEGRLRGLIAKYGRLHPPGGIDYFLFPRDTALIDLPPFAVGRPHWDNWFIYKALKLGIPVVDATRVVTAVHQNHDYVHVKNRRGKRSDGLEGDRNLEVGSTGGEYFCNISYATHVITSNRVLPALGVKYLLRRLKILPVFYPSTKPIIRFLERVYNLIKIKWWSIVQH